MSNVIEFIAKNLYEYSENLTKKVYDVDSICSFSGQRITKGILRKDFISSTFTDYQYLKYDSDYVGLDIALCMEYVIPNGKGKLISLRFKSFYVSEDSIRFLNREDLEGLIFNIPNDKFVLCVSFGFKKHISFKSEINYNRNIFNVYTDKGVCQIDVFQIKELYSILKNWYTVIDGKEDTSQQVTYFTKDDILYGCGNLSRIMNYTGNYYYESEYISRYRNTFLLEFLVHILNKRVKVKNV